jgi:hypothetical protein
VTGESERGHGRPLEVDSPGAPRHQPPRQHMGPHPASTHHREYARRRPLVQGYVKQGKPCGAPCTSQLQKPVHPQKDQGQCANVCGFAPVASRGACRGIKSNRSAEVASTRRSDSNPFSPLPT